MPKARSSLARQDRPGTTSTSRGQLVPGRGGRSPNRRNNLHNRGHRCRAPQHTSSHAIAASEDLFYAPNRVTPEQEEGDRRGPKDGLLNPRPRVGRPGPGRLGDGMPSNDHLAQSRPLVQGCSAARWPRAARVCRLALGFLLPAPCSLSHRRDGGARCVLHGLWHYSDLGN